MACGGKSRKMRVLKFSGFGIWIASHLNQVWHKERCRQSNVMIEGHRNIKYTFPCSKDGARRKMLNWWVLTLVVGVSVALVVGGIAYWAGTF
jgi:hypothetical protein